MTLATTSESAQEGIDHSAPVALRRLIFASFPRSGHHMTVGLLAAYWGTDLRYCETYNDALTPAHNLIKTHDFELNERYFSPRIVLIREPMDSLASFFDWSLRTGRLEVDTYDAWMAFALSKIAYWRGFYVKWLKESRDEKLVVNYSKLLADPLASLTKIIQFQCQGHEVNAELLQAAVGKIKPKIRGSYKTFRYYDPKDDQSFNAAAWL